MENELHNNTAVNLHIAVVGNSVAMRVRPPEQPPDNRNYTVLLREAEAETGGCKVTMNVTNWSSGGATIREIHKSLNDIIRLFPDFYVLNLGVVDASTRDIPRWFFNIINSTNPSRFHRVMKFIHGGLITRFRRPLVLIRGKRSWVSHREFNQLYALLIERLLKETNATIIGLSINLANERVERALPGSRSNHEKYNRIIEHNMQHSRCIYLDLEDFNTEIHFPDGVHFSAEGHRLVADRIIKSIKTFQRKDSQ